MDNRLGITGGKRPLVCATSGRMVAPVGSQAGQSINLGNGFYCFKRAVAPPMTDKLKDELKALAAKEAAKKVAPVAPKKEAK